MLSVTKELFKHVRSTLVGWVEVSPPLGQVDAAGCTSGLRLVRRWHLWTEESTRHKPESLSARTFHTRKVLVTSATSVDGLAYHHDTWVVECGNYIRVLQPVVLYTQTTDAS